MLNGFYKKLWNSCQHFLFCNLSFSVGIEAYAMSENSFRVALIVTLIAINYHGQCIYTNQHI